MDIQDLAIALRKADAAGEVEDARKLAQAIQQLQQGSDNTRNRDRIDDAFDRSNAIVVNRRDIIPFSQLQRPDGSRIEGEFIPPEAAEPQFDSTAGILGSLIRTAKLPGDVLSGKVQVRDASGNITDDVITRSTEFAGVAAPAGVASRGLRTRTLPAKVQNGDPETVARVQAAQNLGVALSQGQGTRNLGLQAREEEILAGTAGEVAQGVLQQQRASQLDQVRSALGNVRDDLAPGSAETVGQAGDLIRDAVIARAQNLKNRSQAGFNNADADISPAALSGLRERVFQRLEAFGANEGTAIAPDLPAVRRMFNRVTEFSELKNAPAGNVTGVYSVKKLQNLRSTLIKNAKGDDRQSEAIREMRRGLDEFLDDALDNGLINGDPKALEELKNARSLWRQYKNITNSPNIAIRKIAEGSLDGSQVANMIVGVTQVGNKQAGANIVREIKSVLGETNLQVINELKRGVIGRLFNDTASGDIKTFGKLAADINRFTSNDAPELARELFGTKGLLALRQLSAVLKNLTPDSVSTNPSRSGQTIIRNFQRTLQNNAGLLGFAAGDLSGLVGGLGLSAFKGRRAVNEARTLSQTPTQRLVRRSRTIPGSEVPRLAIPSTVPVLSTE